MIRGEFDVRVKDLENKQYKYYQSNVDNTQERTALTVKNNTLNLENKRLKEEIERMKKSG